MRILVLLIFIVIVNPLFADDPGITKVRLVQETESSYLFEVDIAQSLISTIKAPVFPERFQLSKPEYENQSGWITIRVRITSTDEPLTPRDEILLPWLRNGADINAQWMDGKTYKGLFNRSLNGIHVPLKELMPVHKTTKEVIQESFYIGAYHLRFMYVHLLLVFVLVLSYSSFRVFKYIISLSFGQMLAMLFINLQVLKSLDLLVIDLFLLLIALFISLATIYKKKYNYLGVLLLLAGFFHGIAYLNEINELGLESLQRIQSLFIFNVTVDVVLYLFALLLLGILPFVLKMFPYFKWFQLISGGIAVFLFLLIFQKSVLTGKSDILNLPKSQVAITYKTPSQSPGLSVTPIQRGTGLMTTPIMVYLSVEPFEVRQEILVKAKAVESLISIDQRKNNIIPVEFQEKIIKEMAGTILSDNACWINGKVKEPAEVITNFITLSRAGVTIGENPTDEKLEDAILGITLIYDVDMFPDSISVNWRYFSDSVSSIEASAVDPHGAFTIRLNPENSILKWKSRLTGFKVAAIEPIAVEIMPTPLISILIWTILVVVAIINWFSKREFKLYHWMSIVIAVSFILYPFVRIRIDIPILHQGKPSAEKGELILNDLLSNVYRAFDRRDEEDVYDRLAMTVSPNQLTEIYMQNRQSMAMENRGGARANVDEVEIKELVEIKRSHKDSYAADISWSVRGSVNHFGHTHYRQNLYRAIISFSKYDNYWKINDIDILDTKRLY